MRPSHSCRRCTTCLAALGTVPRLADTAVGSATLGTRSIRGWADQVQRLITDEACDLGGIAPFTGWRLEFAGQGVPVHSDLAFAFAAPDEQGQTLHWHDQLKRLAQLRGDTQGILLPQVSDLGVVFTLRSFQSQLFACGIGPWSLQALPGLLAQPGVILKHLRQVAVQTALHPTDEGMQMRAYPRRQGTCEAGVQARYRPVWRQFHVRRHGGF